LGLNSWQGKEIILFSTASRQALGLTHPPVQWVQGLFPQEYSGWDVKQTTLLHLVPKSRMVKVYLHSPYIFMA
jgi:hypothetical protein